MHHITPPPTAPAPRPPLPRPRPLAPPLPRPRCRCADEKGPDGVWNTFRDDVDHQGNRIDWGKWAITSNDPTFKGTGNPDTGEGATGFGGGGLRCDADAGVLCGVQRFTLGPPRSWGIGTGMLMSAGLCPQQ